MKKIIAFLFLSFLFQSFTFCQTQEELDLEMEEDLNEVRIKVEPKEEKIFKVVKGMHRFPGCEGQGKSKRELEECSEYKMQEFIYCHLKYPAKARENGTEGEVVVTFSVFNVKIIKDIGNGCGEEVERLILSMNEMPQKWISGKSRGRPFTTNFTLPILFRLSPPQKK